MKIWNAILIVCCAVGAAAEPALKVRIAEPSRGMASDDLILYTADATEFGADKTGKSDSTSAIQAALDACDNVGGGTVFLPAGRYRVEGRLVVNGGTALRGEWVNPAKGGLGKGTILMAFAAVITPSRSPGSRAASSSATPTSGRAIRASPI